MLSSSTHRHTLHPSSSLSVDNPSRGMSENKNSTPSGSSPGIDAVLKRRRASVIEVVDAKSAVDLATAQSYSENIFLFVPNLIGEPVPIPPAWQSSYVLSFFVMSRGPLFWNSFGFRTSRVCSSNPRRPRHALHEPPSKIFDRRVLHLPAFGCRRWTRCQVSRPGVKVRRRT